MYKITVIIPLLKTNSEFQKCVYSALNQNFKDFYILVVSNTDTPKVINGASVRYITIPQAKNIPDLLNKSIDYVDTELVCFLHSDDLLLFDAVKLRYERFLKTPNLVACYGIGIDTDLHYQVKRNLNYEYYFNKKIFVPELNLKELLSGIIQPSITSLMIKTETVKTLQFNNSFKFNYCFDFFIRLLQGYSDNICQVNSPLYISRQEESYINQYKNCYFTRYMNETIQILDKFFDTEILADIELKSKIYKDNYCNFLSLLLYYFPYNYWLRIVLLASYIKKNNELSGKLFEFWYLSILLNSLLITKNTVFLRNLKPNREF